ncbi:OB-fold domain-containing protein [Arthrobacter sp. ISL-28]|uniref:OB-fold domain-containing protein n=1 Tax=Arthrobacter sp. ISL-28 TaxID=2819108 RepID=UPI0037BE39B2
MCHGQLQAAEFGPGGAVWSSTVFRVPLDGRVPPWSLAYVDLDEGPRILAHVAGSTGRLDVGRRVELVGESAEGDVVVRELGVST